MKRFLLATFLLCAALLGVTPSAVQAQNASFGWTPASTTQTMSVTNSSSTITLSATMGSTVFVQNIGSTTAYVKSTGGTATTSDFPLQAGWGVLMNLPPGQTVAAITSAGTTTLTFSKGQGATAITGGGGSGSAVTSNSATNPTSTLTMTSATTAYTAGQLIATSATAGSVVNPSFAILNTAGGAIINRLRLSINDATSTSWGGQAIQVDLWTTTPTWTNGDRATWPPATGTGAHLATFTCTMSSVYGDGAYSECAVTPGNVALPKLASGTTIYWSLKATTGSGVTGTVLPFWYVTISAEQPGNDELLNHADCVLAVDWDSNTILKSVTPPGTTPSDFAVSPVYAGRDPAALFAAQ